MKALAIAVAGMLAATGTSGAVRVHIEEAEPAGAAALMLELSQPVGERVELAGIGFVTLRDRAREFWAPFDLQTFTPIGPNKASRLVLAPRETRKARIDLAALRWAKTISSIWPVQPLEKAVPAGTYDAQVTIEQRPDQRLSSNVIVVVVKFTR